MFRSDDVILVTRDGAPAGFYLPWGMPELPVEVRREVFLRLSEQIGSQLTEQGTSARERSSTTSLPAAVVADANVVLSARASGFGVVEPLREHPWGLRDVRVVDPTAMTCA